jgi:hypothetical protein
MMNSFIKKVLLFVFFFIIAYPLMILILGSLPLPQVCKPNFIYERGAPGHTLNRLQEAKKCEGDIDILFLGSSHTYRGFDPRNFKNHEVFNLGSSSQAPTQTKILLNKYIEKINPKIVVYEVYPLTFTLDGIESAVDIIANEDNDSHSLQMALTLNHIKVYNTLLYAYITDVLKVNKSNIQPSKLGRDTYISGGYVESEIRFYKFENYQSQEWKINEKQLEEFNKCLHILEKRKIKTILVFAPITPKLYQSYSNNDYIDSLFNSYGLEYYNFNTLLEINDSIHFYDADHLNQHGVTIFNEKLKNTINFSQ